ncbi:hypothetical protein [Ruminococcus flavefaciens]|uniref:hypothetical protein n=1 Tax=Ruminococcus flavefaciens TaxID=1265 RepID=UPI0026EF18B4|nr:hypothetical protein [Ruminococcus flavefaciens]MDD7516496.1 hypothetical protein [Ruminococcus flavefaciens]MDY5690770.1 hypothetical protein [Ruminococcus flavefaciens]
MTSFQWQIISEIFLGIGIVLMLTAFMIAARYKVISNTVSEIRSRKNPAGPAENVHSAAMNIRSRDIDIVSDIPTEEEIDSGQITVVVAKKKQENISDTIVISNNDEKKKDFRIIRNIIVINADPDVIDGHRRTK